MWSQSILDEFLKGCYTYGMSEKIIIKTVGGPQDAVTRVVDRGEAGWPWPPPLNINVPGYKGVYVRESFSNIPSELRHSNVMRGAQYQWVED
jgi:hypothetical protein